MIESAGRFRKQMLPDKVGVVLMLHPKSAVERSAPAERKVSSQRQCFALPSRIASAGDLKVIICDFGDDLPNARRALRRHA